MIGDRHSGSAGGALDIGGRPVSVEIRLGSDAQLPPLQHTAWMLLNILCRLQGAVSVIRINCPAEVKTITNLSPLVDNGLLLNALVAGAKAIGSPADGFVPVEANSDLCSDVIVGVSFEYSEECTFCAIGNGFCGGIFARPIVRPEKLLSLTVGPYVAACLAAGEVFRQVRLKNYVAEHQLFLNLLDYSHSEDPIWSDFETPHELYSVLLAGVGAVGTALLHTLYPLELQGTIWAADNDKKGIEDTNLNRYSLFGWNSIGKQKASEAATLFEESSINIVPHDGGFEWFFEAGYKPQIVFSAVDNNGVRHAIQEQYVPLFFSASTFELRTEILRCGPPSSGACLACFNPLEKHARSEEEMRKALQDRPESIENLCKKLNLDPVEVVRWIQKRKCSETGERLIQELRTDYGALPGFSVAFVSILAGVMLAGELLKLSSGWPGILNESSNRAVFQFINPVATTNRAHFYGRDDKCAACDPNNTGSRIWKSRYENLRGSQRGTLASPQ